MGGVQAGEQGERPYTESFEQVLEVEREYLTQRRRRCRPPLEAFDRDRVWGLCLSGGGIRSATFGLGVLQSLIQARLASRFDYLSTVSGGGYLGACLSSLLTHHDEGNPHGKDLSLEPEGSPFVAYRVAEAMATDPLDEDLSVRTQMHHLRTHGEYLAPHEKGWLSHDVQRALGSVASGMAHHFILAALALVVCVAALHALVGAVDPGLALLRPKPAAEVEGSVTDLLAGWWMQQVQDPAAALVADAWTHAAALAPWAGVGLAFTALAIGWALVASRRWRAWDAVRRAPRFDTRSGWTTEQTAEARFIRWLNGTSVGLVVGLTIAYGCQYAQDPTTRRLGIFVPLSFGVGGLGASLLVNVIESFGRDRVGRRSLLRAIQGAVFYGLGLSALLPVGLLLVASLSSLAWGRIVIAALSLGATYLLSRQAPSDAGAGPKRLLSGARLDLLLNALVAVAILLAVSVASDRLLQLYGDAPSGSLAYCALAVGAVAAGALGVLGVAVDSNRISPHYFYRDRLSDAFLRTFASIPRPAGDKKGQGMPLAPVRDGSRLKLCELGQGNGSGPYHLIVTALNLSGSDELKRKTMLSDHFVFSRDYVGSSITGWAPTAGYRDGETRLARAMTISGAAVAGAAGRYSTAWWSFVLTLFNARLGYWMLNPWVFGRGRRRERPLRFWPLYLAREMLGRIHARGELVNLSDGGHTGDNLGLLPLVERRCQLILVCDGEADGSYGFGSFVNAVRMANVERNVRVELPDLDRIVPGLPGPDGLRTSPRSVVDGRIRYADGSTGRIVYVKASLPPGLPADVAGYARSHPAFPHQSTGDQFFDDAQFESYRALGETIGREAAGILAQLSPELRASGA